jgi:glutathione S-transferase
MGVFWGFYRTPEPQRNLPGIAAKIRACARHFRLLDCMLADRLFLCGDDLTLADIPAATSLYRYFAIEIERPSVPNVEAWYQRLQERAAYRDLSWSRSATCMVASITREVVLVPT